VFAAVEVVLVFEVLGDGLVLARPCGVLDEELDVLRSMLAGRNALDSPGLDVHEVRLQPF